MGSLGNRSQTRSLIVLCTLCTALVSESQPVRRSVSEFQLMHDLGRLLYGSKRQELIKDVVRDVHTASEKDLIAYALPLSAKYPRPCKHSSAAGKQQSKGKSKRQRNAEKGRMKRLLTDDFSGVGELHDPDRLPEAFSPSAGNWD